MRTRALLRYSYRVIEILLILSITAGCDIVSVKML
jgi:hypothetical protein